MDRKLLERQSESARKGWGTRRKRRGRGRARQREVTCDESRGSVTDHVLVRRVTMREAGQGSVLLNTVQLHDSVFTELYSIGLHFDLNRGFEHHE